MVLFIGLSMLAYEKFDRRSLMILVLTAVVMVPVGWRFILRDYQKDRILTLLDADVDRLGSGWHALQARVAVGSGGVLGSEAALAAPADGYSFVFHTLSSAVINAGLYRNLSFDVRQAFLPVSLVGVLPNVILVNGRFPARNLAELIALLRANPGKYTYASSGNGTITHLSAQLLMTMIGAQALHVPYRGSGPALQDLAAAALVRQSVRDDHVEARQQRRVEVGLAVGGADDDDRGGGGISDSVHFREQLRQHAVGDAAGASVAALAPLPAAPAPLHRAPVCAPALPSPRPAPHLPQPDPSLPHSALAAGPIRPKKPP
jgi:hypothetical protein